MYLPGTQNSSGASVVPKKRSTGPRKKKSTDPSPSCVELLQDNAERESPMVEEDTTKKTDAGEPKKNSFLLSN